jgi:hypothetical protein
MEGQKIATPTPTPHQPTAKPMGSNQPLQFTSLCEDKLLNNTC